MKKRYVYRNGRGEVFAGYSLYSSEESFRASNPWAVEAIACDPRDISAMVEAVCKLKGMSLKAA